MFNLEKNTLRTPEGRPCGREIPRSVKLGPRSSSREMAIGSGGVGDSCDHSAEQQVVGLRDSSCSSRVVWMTLSRVLQKGLLGQGVD